MACCCGPQVCLCSTPPGGVKASQVLIQLSGFSPSPPANPAFLREQWRDFALSTITGALNGISVYLAPTVIPGITGATYAFNQTFSSGPCSLLSINAVANFRCDDGSSSGGARVTIRFRAPASPQFAVDGALLTTCGLQNPPGDENSPGAFSVVDSFATNANVCTMQAGSPQSCRFAFFIGGNRTAYPFMALPDNGCDYFGNATVTPI